MVTGVCSVQCGDHDLISSVCGTWSSAMLVWLQSTLTLAGAEHVVKCVQYHFLLLVNTCLQLLDGY